MMKIHGQPVDNETRCIHYHGETDVVAIKFACCNKYYPCIYCHEEAVDHKREVWKKDEHEERAILCGVCKTEHTISTYVSQSSCRSCGAIWNENCKFHYHFYFEEV